MKIILKIALTASLFATLSCQSKEEPISRAETLNVGFTMMDQGKYDEAIAYFAKLADTDPHPHVKQAWASAYAGKAGISFSKIVGIATVKTDDEALKAPSALKQIDRKAGEYLEIIQRYERHWDKVPAVSGQQIDDLQKSLQILATTTSPGTRIYSATLRVVLLKSAIEQGVKQWEALSLQSVCTDQLKPYVNWAADVLEGLRLIVNDLEYAFPKNKESYQALQQQLQEVSAQAKVMTWPKERQCF